MLKYYMITLNFDLDSRSVAQLGRALPSGGRGRRFESSHSDQDIKSNLCQGALCKPIISLDC